MNLITENPFPILMIGVLIAGAGFSFGVILKQRRLIWVGVAAVLVTLGFVILEQWIVTDRERLQDQIFGMARCVRKNDVEALAAFTVDENNNRHGLYARQRILNEMPNYHFKACRVSNIRIEMKEDQKEADVKFLAYVNVDATKTYDYRGLARREVLLRFQKQADDEWKVIYFQHWEPTSLLNL